MVQLLITVKNATMIMQRFAFICYQCLEHKRQLVKQHEELLRRKERLQKLKSNHNGKRAYPNGRRDGVNRSKRMRLTRRKK